MKLHPHLHDRQFRNKSQPSQPAEATRSLDFDHACQLGLHFILCVAVDYRGQEIRAKEDLPASELGRSVLRLQLQVDRCFQDAERESATEKQGVIRHKLSCAGNASINKELAS